MKAKLTITLLFAIIFAMFAAPAMAEDSDAVSAMKAAVTEVTGAYYVPGDVSLSGLGIDSSNLKLFVDAFVDFYYDRTGVLPKLTFIDTGDEQWMGIVLDTGDEQWM